MAPSRCAVHSPKGNRGRLHARRPPPRAPCAWPPHVHPSQCPAAAQLVRRAGALTRRNLAHKVDGQHIAGAVGPGWVPLTLPLLLAHIPARGHGRLQDSHMQLLCSGAESCALQAPPRLLASKLTLLPATSQNAPMCCAMLRCSAAAQPGPSPATACPASPLRSPLAAGVAVGAAAGVFDVAPEQPLPCPRQPRQAAE